MNASLDERVYLVRHARTELNADGLLRGHLDPPLDEVGRGEAEELAVVLASLGAARVVTSPLRRAVQTAEVIASRASALLVVDTGLIDRDYGAWAGRAEQDVVADCGSLDQAPGVEPVGSVARRARAVLEAQVSALRTGPVVLVAHDAVNRFLLSDVDPELGPPERIGQRTACWNVLSHVDGVWAVERVDEKVE